MSFKLGSIIVFVLFLVSLNILFLDIALFTKPSREAVSVIAEPKREDASTCPAACTVKIEEAVSQMMPVTTPELASPTVAPVPKAAAEYYIPLGSGTTKSSEYEGLSGAEAYINTENYPSIKQVTFEVFLRNPTGNGRVYAKLYNVTDKHDVWFSEVFFEGGGIIKREAAITLDGGNKLYRVVMKSTMKYDVYADTARVKIVTN